MATSWWRCAVSSFYHLGDSHQLITIESTQPASFEIVRAHPLGGLGFPARLLIGGCPIAADPRQPRASLSAPPSPHFPPRLLHRAKRQCPDGPLRSFPIAPSTLKYACSPITVQAALRCAAARPTPAGPTPDVLPSRHHSPRCLGCLTEVPKHHQPTRSDRSAPSRALEEAMKNS